MMKPSLSRFLPFSCLLFALSTPASAVIYVCKEANGSTTFSDQPCLKVTIQESRIYDAGDLVGSYKPALRLVDVKAESIKQGIKPLPYRRQAKISGAEMKEYEATQRHATDAGIHLLEYRLIGRAEDINVTYKGWQGSSVTKTVSLPWRVYFPAGEGFEAFVGAQGIGEETVDVMILLDGVPVVVERSSPGHQGFEAAGRI